MTGDGIAIREAQEGDFGRVMSLVRTCYGEAAEPPEWWRWRHREFDPSNSVMFVAVDRQEIVGLRPMAVFDYFLRGESIKGGLFSAVMVHPDYRRQGIFSRLVEACAQEAWRRGAAFVHTMPNDVSYPGFVKLGWHDPGDRTLLVRPLDVAAIFGKKVGPHWLAATLAFLPQAGLSLSRPRAKWDFVIDQVESFDDAAEALASRVAKELNGIVLQRTRRWLNWRFKSNPWNRYQRFAATSRRGDLVGFAVTNTENRSGLRVGYVVELIADSSDARRALIEAATSSLRQQGAALVATVVSDPELAQAFRRQRFFMVPQKLSPKRFHTVYQPRPGCAGDFESVRAISAWYQTLGDWDGI